MTQLKSFDASGVQFAWDATSVSSFEKCPRYYQYKHIEGWQADNKSVHLIFGGLYATALEHYFKLTFDGATPDEAMLSVIRETLVSTWDHEISDDGSPIPESGHPWNSYHNAKTRETLIRSIIWYFDHFEEDTTETVKLSDGTPAVEYSFSLPLTDEIIWCGHIDRLVTYAGNVYVMDQKTSGATITARFFQNFTPDIQMSGYTYAGKIIFDLPIAGVIIDAAQIAVGFTRFERGFITRAQHHLDDWLVSTLHTIKLAQEATRASFFPMNRMSCGNYGGCEFREICSRMESHRPNLLEATFHREKRWDPLEAR